ncbi:MAG: methyl-accepting chemotaxis protein, partial [Myxococcota bacterium]
PDLTGVSFGYEPDADAHDAAAAGAVRLDPQALAPGGRFAPYWFRDRADPSIIRLAPLADMETSYYYRGVRNRVQRRPEGENVVLPGGISTLYEPAAPDVLAREPALITEPYDYEGKYIVEHAAPIVIDGRFVGVAAVDRSLNEIDSFLAALRGHESGEFILISRRGRIIAATMDPSLRARAIETTPYADILRAAYLEPGGVPAVVDDPVRGGRYYFASARVPTGGWTLVMAVSQDEILAPVRQAVRESLLVAALGTLAVLVILVLFMGSIARRIEVAADAAARVSDGDLTVHVDPSGGDETGVLLRAIDAMVKSLRALVGAGQHSSVRLVSTANELAVAARREEAQIQEFSSSTSQIAAAVKEISTTSQELVRTMEEVTRATAETATLADSGRSGLDGMEGAMRRLDGAAGSISERLAVIN